ncbi:MAG TPA: hypothetical protein VMK65_00470, partial [Longimicrobiales bacterium]|nr:hypothetical protein [Longimicrobiales bacterium]
MRRSFAVLLVMVVLPWTTLGAQSSPADPDSLFWSALEWRPIGPANFAGRITDVEGVPGTRTFYIAAASGGIWKTTNNGTTFRPIFDGERVISMGDIAIAPSDPDVIYAGTGEEDSRNSISPGGGVYRSTDGGETWTLTGLEATQAVGRIVVHPTNPDVAWVAALGRIWGPNPERGLYKTTDGGASWRLVKHISERAGFVDVALHPRDPNTLFAASWERVRGPYFLKSGGPGSALWKSTDGGESWTEVTGGGFPGTEKGRIGLAIAPSDPDVMYAMVEAVRGEDPEAEGQKGSGLYRSADGGRTWTHMSSNNVRPFYYSQVRVDPRDPDYVVWSSTPVNFSKDGGKTVGQTTLGIHVDHHAMWWDPTDPDHYIVGNDGGIAITWDKGGTYDFVNNVPLGQFYDVSYDMSVPYRVCGGLQDNGTWCGPSRRARGAITTHMWATIHGGDGFYSAQDPRNPAIVYAESQRGNMSRVNLLSGERTSLEKPSWREATSELRDSIALLKGDDIERELSAAEQRKVDAWQAAIAADSAALDLRYNWNTPFLLSPHDPDVFYAAGNRVLRAVDGGPLEPISPDLTYADTMKIRVSMRTTGGITRDATGAETYGTITALSESPRVKGLLYAGTDDGRVWKSPDGGASWEELTGRFPGVPAGTYVSRVTPSAHEDGRVYVAFDGHRMDDFTPYVYASEDGGRSFRSIAADLPSGGIDFVHVITEDPVNADLLYVGTDVGAYLSTDRGRSWRRFMEGLPTVPVHDLEVHPRDRELIAGTHGRSIWIVDVAPLQQLRGGAPATEAVAFEPKPALQYGDVPMGGESAGHRVFA